MSPRDLTKVPNLEAKLSIHALLLEITDSHLSWGPGGNNKVCINEASLAGIVAKWKYSCVY